MYKSAKCGALIVVSYGLPAPWLCAEVAIANIAPSIGLGHAQLTRAVHAISTMCGVLWQARRRCTCSLGMRACPASGWIPGSHTRVGNQPTTHSLLARSDEYRGTRYRYHTN